MSVGQTLAEAREQRGLSVEDVSEATRIRGGLIRAIERDDFGPCGGDVYARGHIRSISRVLGIDPTPLVTEYDTAHEPAEPAVVAAAPAPPETDRQALAHSERRSPNWAAAMVLALLVVIGVAAYSAFGTGGAKKSGNTVAQSQNSTVTNNSAPAKTKKQPTQQTQRNRVAQLQSNKAILQIRATSAVTWVQVSNAATNAVLFQGNLEPGQHKRFIKPYALTFVIGNAPATDVVVGSKDIGSPPSSGNVARGKVQPGSQQIQQA